MMPLKWISTPNKCRDCFVASFVTNTCNMHSTQQYEPLKEQYSIF